MVEDAQKPIFNLKAAAKNRPSGFPNSIQFALPP